MKIFGIGTDIIQISRMKKSLKKDSFLTRLFSDDEIKNCKKKVNSISCYAKRFASKEAFSKALGTGVAKGIKFKEINILNEKNGKPYIKLLGNTKKITNKKIKKKNYKISLSISDEKNYAVAFVTISV